MTLLQHSSSSLQAIFLQWMPQVVPYVPANSLHLYSQIKDLSSSTSQFDLEYIVGKVKI